MIYLINQKNIYCISKMGNAHTHVLLAGDTQYHASDIGNAKMSIGTSRCDEPFPQQWIPFFRQGNDFAEWAHLKALTNFSKDPHDCFRPLWTAQELFNETQTNYLYNAAKKPDGSINFLNGVEGDYIIDRNSANFSREEMLSMLPNLASDRTGEQIAGDAIRNNAVPDFEYTPIGVGKPNGQPGNSVMKYSWPLQPGHIGNWFGTGDDEQEARIPRQPFEIDPTAHLDQRQPIVRIASDDGIGYITDSAWAGYIWTSNTMRWAKFTINASSPTMKLHKMSLCGNTLMTTSQCPYTCGEVKAIFRKDQCCTLPSTAYSSIKVYEPVNKDVYPYAFPPLPPAPSPPPSRPPAPPVGPSPPTSPPPAPMATLVYTKARTSFKTFQGQPANDAICAALACDETILYVANITIVNVDEMYGIDFTMTDIHNKSTSAVTVNGVKMTYVNPLLGHIADGVSWGSQDHTFDEAQMITRRVMANAEPVPPAAYSLYLVSTSPVPQSLTVTGLKISGAGNTAVIEYEQYPPFLITAPYEFLPQNRTITLHVDARNSDELEGRPVQCRGEMTSWGANPIVAIDDGTHGDEIAGDKVYACQFVAPTEPETKHWSWGAIIDDGTDNGIWANDCCNNNQVTLNPDGSVVSYPMILRKSQEDKVNEACYHLTSCPTGWGR